MIDISYKAVEGKWLCFFCCTRSRKVLYLVREYYLQYYICCIYKVFKCGITICFIEKKMLFFAVSIKRNTNCNPSNMLGVF